MPPPPEPPKETDAEIRARVEQERMRALNASGLGATVITGGLGASDFGAAGVKGATVLGKTAA
jgi:hypothetical protein